MSSEGSPSEDPVIPDRLVTPPLLERRLSAAAVDVAIVLLCCAAIFHSFSPRAVTRHPWVWKPGAVLLAADALLEMLTGITLGKILSRLALRRRDGLAPSIGALVIRAAFKFLPVVIFLLAFLADRTMFVPIVAAALTVAIMEVQACYLSLARTGKTIFDHVAGTMVVRTGRTRAEPAKA